MSRTKLVSLPAGSWDIIFGSKPKAKPAPESKAAAKPKPASQPKAAAKPVPKSMSKPGVEPGIYRDIPFDEYLSWPHVNNTLLGAAAKSMAHFQ